MSTSTIITSALSAHFGADEVRRRSHTVEAAAQRIDNGASVRTVLSEAARNYGVSIPETVISRIEREVGATSTQPGSVQRTEQPSQVGTADKIKAAAIAAGVRERDVRAYGSQIDAAAARIDGGEDATAVLTPLAQRAGLGSTEIANIVSTLGGSQPDEGEVAFLTEAQFRVLFDLMNSHGVPMDEDEVRASLAGVGLLPQPEPEVEDETTDGAVTLDAVMKAVADIGKTVQSLVDAAVANGIRLN